MGRDRVVRLVYGESKSAAWAPMAGPEGGGGYSGPVGGGVGAFALGSHRSCGP